jgi:methylenetetrahydrofolate--tRNA-(uracil-5-)-methyltransferase
MYRRGLEAFTAWARTDAGLDVTDPAPAPAEPAEVPA